MEEPGTAKNVALTWGVAESTVSRAKDTLDNALALVYQLGFKVVPESMHCMPEDYLRALHTMARMSLDSGPKLEWD